MVWSYFEKSEGDNNGIYDICGDEVQTCQRDWHVCSGQSDMIDAIQYDFIFEQNYN